MRNAIKINRILQELQDALAAGAPPHPPVQPTTTDLLGQLAVTMVGLEIIEGHNPL